MKQHYFSCKPPFVSTKHVNPNKESFMKPSHTYILSTLLFISASAYAGDPAVARFIKVAYVDHFPETQVGTRAAYIAMCTLKK